MPSGDFIDRLQKATQKSLFLKQGAELISSHSYLPQFQAINKLTLWFCTSPWLMTLRSSVTQTMDLCHCCTEANQVTGNVLLWVVILISGNYGLTASQNSAVGADGDWEKSMFQGITCFHCCTFWTSLFSWSYTF